MKLKAAFLVPWVILAFRIDVLPCSADHDLVTGINNVYDSDGAGLDN